MNRVSVIRVVRGLAAAAALLAGPLAAATPASAGQFSVYACKTPAGHAVPLPGATLSSVGSNNAPVDACSTGGAATVKFGDDYQLYGESSRIELAAPAGMTISRLELRRRIVWADGLASGNGNSYSQPYWFIYRDGAVHDSAHVLETCGFVGGLCNGYDSLSPTVPPTSFSFGNPAPSKVGWGFDCIGALNSTCDGLDPGPRVVADTSSVFLLVNETGAPTGSATGAAVAPDVTHSGTEAATVSGADAGAGVYQAIARIDGVEAGRATVGGACSDRGNTQDSDLDFESFRPCPAQADLTLSVDTRKVPDGPARRLRIYVRDAAGNETQVADQVLRITNGIPDPQATPTPTAAPGPAPTPTPLDPAAVGAPAGRIVLDGKQPSVTVRGGRKATVSGKLVDLGGVPLAGARVVVSEQLAIAGAAWVEVNRLTTDARGAFVFVPTTSASRTLRFAYGFGPAGDLVASQTFAVKVTAPISIRSGTPSVRRGGTVKLSGTVSLAHLPAKGTRLEIQVRSGSRWQSIDRAKVSKTGRWSWSYALRRSTHASYAFRAYLPSTADVPAEPSSSAAVTVRVRR